MRLVFLLYGSFAYLSFLAAILYAIGFVGGLGVPKGIDDGALDSLGSTLLVNAGLLGLFAVQHTVMARPAFKAWWKRIVPPVLERSTFVLVTDAILFLLYWQWRPLPQLAWSVEGPALTALLHALFWGGWVVVFASSFMIDHFDLFGLRQVWLHWQGRDYEPPRYREILFYRWVRHPLMLGLIVAFWAAPVMSWGRLLFAASCTGYILLAIQIEERDLLAAHGASYDAYRRRVPQLVPLLRGAGGGGGERPRDLSPKPNA
jgi:protein-S-isoprenylcysteine O-methyltransferase Ste14